MIIIIKDLVSKSIQLIAVAIAISILITLCLSNVVEAYKLVQVPANGLTNNYFDISIGEYRDKIVNNNLTLPDLLEFLNKQNTDILLLKEATMKVFGVYAVNHKFRPNIISGRTFSKEDFQNKTNTILIGGILGM
jgi:thiamine kinase-like enzyme